MIKMNINKMNREQLKFLLEMNNNTLESLRIGLQNWRNTMIQSHVETGEMSQEEFEEKWKEAQEQSKLRIDEIEKENSEIYERLQA